MRWMAALALSVMMMPSVAGATIVQALDLEQLAKKAAVVVHGRVVERTSAWNPEHTRIYTVTRVQIVDSLKGPHSASATIDVRQLGGTVDGISQTIVGNARLHTDEEVVLFLDHDPGKRLHYVVGMAQGKYAVDRRTTPPVVVRDLKGIALADIQARQLTGLRTPAETPTAAPSLSAFKDRIRRALQPKP